PQVLHRVRLDAAEHRVVQASDGGPGEEDRQQDRLDGIRQCPEDRTTGPDRELELVAPADDREQRITSKKLVISDG
ncbi:MAG: hypothetical protein QGH45_22735, partial [Myxococcota bacterium]|nr:hypothetical protein [Myxococcota bacterium]